MYNKNKYSVVKTSKIRSKMVKIGHFDDEINGQVHLSKSTDLIHCTLYHRSIIWGHKYHKRFIYKIFFFFFKIFVFTEKINLIKCL